uniref:Uncharacterized protein n=1 Tax=Arundo donax TaxID=35708 RepID=A0A0A9GNB6_ARUDO
MFCDTLFSCIFAFSPFPLLLKEHMQSC